MRNLAILFIFLFAFGAMGMTPRRHSAWWTFLITNGWLVVVAGVNGLVGSNYMYLSHPPEAASPLIVLSWPWYVIVADVLLGVGFVGLQWLTCRRRRS